MVQSGVTTRAATLRALGFAVLWILLTGGNRADLGAGAIGTVAATWTSLRLLPPETGRVRPLALVGFALRFLCQSLFAGVDVARRALDPRLPLDPGFVVYPIGLPRGPARHMFTTLMSLLPGTVPTSWEANGRLVIHCLDVGQPVAAQLMAEEAHFVRVLGKVPSDG